MTKKELQRYYWTQKNIEKLEERLQELYTAATKITSQLSDDPIRPGGMKSDRVGNIVAQMEDVKRELADQIEKAYAEVKKIEIAIQVLPAREMYLIRERYIANKPWEQIAVDMEYSWQHLHRVHSEALKILRGGKVNG